MYGSAAYGGASIGGASAWVTYSVEIGDFIPFAGDCGLTRGLNFVDGLSFGDDSGASPLYFATADEAMQFADEVYAAITAKHLYDAEYEVLTGTVSAGSIPFVLSDGTTTTLPVTDSIVMVDSSPWHMAGGLYYVWAHTYGGIELAESFTAWVTTGMLEDASITEALALLAAIDTFTESCSVEESAAWTAILSPFYEYPIISETIAKLMAMSAADSLAVSESSANRPTIPEWNSVGLDDVAAWLQTKRISDVTAMSELSVRGGTKAADDAMAVSESIVRALRLPMSVETVVLDALLAVTQARSLADVVDINDYLMMERPRRTVTSSRWLVDVYLSGETIHATDTDLEVS